MRLQIADVRHGMVLPTIGGRSAVRNIIRTTNQGRERRTIIFANGIVATNLRLTDSIEVKEAR